ncbi:MAG: hypothetical protein ACK5M3_05260 [Dysgonomonas sp.]
MRKHIQFFIFFVILFFSSVSINAQFRDRAKKVIDNIVNEKERIDTLKTDSLSQTEKHIQDSIQIQEMMLQIQEMKLNEILLRTELEDVQSVSINDSLRKATQRRRIDSLRALTPGIPVIVNNDTILVLYTKKGGLTAHKRAENIQKTILDIGQSYSLRTDSVYILESENLSDIMYGEKVIFSVTDQDALWHNMPRNELAQQYVPIVAKKITELKKEHSILQIAKRIGLFVLVLIIQFFLWKGTSYLFRKLRRKIIWLMHNKLKSITIKDYEFLDIRKQGQVLMFSSKILQYVVILIQLAITIPILFSIFPQTETLAIRLFTYIFDPVKMIFASIITYIPNLFIIVIIPVGGIKLVHI